MGDLQELNRRASVQHGVITRGQALESGFDRHAVHRRIVSGQWLRLDHGVYALSSSAPSWERRLMAATLSRPLALVGHTSAGRLLGLRNCFRSRPTIIVPKGSNVRSDIARIIESDQFDSLATTHLGAFTVTTVPETLLALAADFNPTEMEATFDDALLTGKLDLDSMKAILDREAGRRPRGMKSLRELTSLRLPTAPIRDATYLERLLVRVLSHVDIPPFTQEHPFSLVGRPARVDVYIAEWSLVIEADGRNWHLRRGDFETDRRRDNELAARGIQVLRYTYRMLADEPSRCLDEIMAVGRIRTAQRPA